MSRLSQLLAPGLPQVKQLVSETEAAAAEANQAESQANQLADLRQRLEASSLAIKTERCALELGCTSRYKRCFLAGAALPVHMVASHPAAAGLDARAIPCWMHACMCNH